MCVICLTTLVQQKEDYMRHMLDTHFSEAYILHFGEVVFSSRPTILLHVMRTVAFVLC